MVERIKKCENPSDVCAISFTNAAADELRERLERDGYPHQRLRWCGTLHSFAITEMSRMGEIGAIMGDAEKEETITYVIKTLGAAARNMSKKEIWECALSVPAFGNGKSIGKAVRAWFKTKGGTHIDFVLPDFFDRLDMVSVPEEILVDEYQDSGSIDSDIYNHFARRGCRLWVVGDVRQSIFGFRGARPDIMLDETLMERTKTYQLKTNYRSVPSICAFGTRLGRAMKGMEHLDPEIIPADKENFGAMFITHGDYDSSEEESLHVAEWAGAVDGTCAVLCRYRDQTQQVAAILRAKGITLSASTDRELDSVAEAWITKIHDGMFGNTTLFQTPDFWSQIMTFTGVPFDTQRALLPRLLHCHSAADIAGLALEDAEPEECNVFVGTVHSAKGKEYDHVWVTGVDAATYHPADQETLRLLFVGATRARYSLTLSYARSRIQPGSMKRITVEPSEFLKLL
jgi:superfamily I DNA/RNA helicase